MPIALEQFVRQLTDSGVISPGKLADFIPPKAHPQDADELARELIRGNVLTKFQAQQALAGKAKALSLGNYTIVDRIGAGGMGQVFKAEHRRMHRTVAIKMLSPSVTSDATAIARFQREVEAAAKLEHPNIVAAYDADEANGAHFLVMQFVDGSDLSAKVKRDGTLSVAKAVDYLLQAARGLEFAHGEGVVHRDIKPSNLLLDKKGVVRILDMGLARINAPGAAAARPKLTAAGTIMGTVDFMSPEQALSTTTADERADIYALGCSLYYLLVGKAMYGGATMTAKLLAHQEQPIPSLHDVDSEVPPRLDSIFRKMVAKQVGDRYQSMSQVIVDLESVRDSFSVDTGMSMHVSSSAGTRRSVAATKPSTAAATEREKTLIESPPRRRRISIYGACAVGAVLLMSGLLALGFKDKRPGIASAEPGLPINALKNEHDGRAPGVKRVTADAPSWHASLPSIDTARELAEWTIRRGGSVAIGNMAGIQRVEQLPENCDALLTLSLYGVEDVDDEIVANLVTWPPLPARLSLSHTSITDAALVSIGRSGRHLTHLLLERCSISSAGIAELAKLPHLHVLNLGERPIDDATLAMLGRFPQLGSIHLASTAITRDQLAILAANPRLTNLNLESNNLDDAALGLLVKLPNLELLQLGDNRIGNAGLANLESLQKLKRVGLRQTRVTAAGVAKLRAALPNCVIDWDNVAADTRKPPANLPPVN